MRHTLFISVSKAICSAVICLTASFSNAQEQPDPTVRSRNAFWSRVQFGGGLGLAIGSGYSDISVAPGAIYNFSKQFALGAGLQYSYINQKDYYNSHLYGGSVVALFSPAPMIQVSLEVEQLRVNLDVQDSEGVTNTQRDFWNTGLFVGAGYRVENVTIGARYNLLFDADKNVYSDAFMPFIRAYF